MSSSRKFAGRLFQTRGTATAKLLSPTISEVAGDWYSANDTAVQFKLVNAKGQRTYKTTVHLVDFRPAALQLRLSACIDDVSLWMTSNRLQLNPTKTEMLWCASARRQQHIPVGPVRIGDTAVSPATAVRDLGVHLDADMSMTAHVTAVSSIRTWGYGLTSNLRHFSTKITII